MPPSCEAYGRARVDGCAGPRAYARWLSGASAWVLPPAAPPRLINKSIEKPLPSCGRRRGPSSAAEPPHLRSSWSQRCANAQPSAVGVAPKM